jgi:membrane dipeptidase
VVTEEAKKLHAECLVVDSHNDLPWAMREKSGPNFRSIDLRKNQPGLHTDIPRLRTGGVGVQFWSAWVPTETRRKGTAIRETLTQIDAIYHLVETYPETFTLCQSVAEIEAARKAGKIASLIGLEGGYSIDNSLAVLRMYRRMGAMYMTLTHSETIEWADSATDEVKHKGLTKFGEEVVLEMNRLGMMVDISHVSPDTMKHAIRVSKAPVIASHSSARALADHRRNVPDDVLTQVKENGGVVMVNFYSGFVVPEAVRLTRDMFERARKLREEFPDDRQFNQAMEQYRKDNPIPKGSIHDVVDHIDHIVKVAGIDHVGLGSDYDGINATPEQLGDVSTYPLITQELLNRGYKPDQIRKILGGNLMRVFAAVEKTAKDLSGGKAR